MWNDAIFTRFEVFFTSNLSALHLLWSASVILSGIFFKIISIENLNQNLCVASKVTISVDSVFVAKISLFEKGE